MKTNETDTTTATATQSTKSTVLLSIDKIRPNPNNPRRSYDENALAELAASIATHGLIQPIRVRAAEQGGYIIVCGERRYRAVQLLGQTEIEAIVDAVPAGEVAAQGRGIACGRQGVDRGHAFRELYDVVLLQSVEHVAVEGRGDDGGEHGTEGDEEEGV